MSNPPLMSCGLPGATSWNPLCGGGFFGAGMPQASPNLQGTSLGPNLEGSDINPGQLVIDVGNPFPTPVVAPDTGKFLGPLILPAVIAPAVLGGLATGGAAGIVTSLVTGAVPPVESLTESGLEPQPAEALGPPSVPPGSPVASAGETPPNWWDMMQGFPRPTLGVKDVLDWLSQFQPPGTTGIGKAIWNLIAPEGNVSDPGSLFGPSADSSAGSAGPSVTIAPTDLPTITVEAPRPARAPPLVADPVLTPVGLPEPGFIAQPAPAAPARPGRTPAPAPNPLITPSPVRGPGPRRVGAPSQVPFPLPSPVAQPTPGANPTPVPSPIQSPQPSPTRAVPLPLPPVIIGPSVAPGAPGPTLVGYGVVPSLGEMPEELAQAQPGTPSAQKNCVQTKTKDKGKKKKHQRSVCHVGTYRELKQGLIKHATRTIPCQ